ncbi:MAG TPA: kelch repeat-containing protein [Acidobacteriota bacterium]|nr:kelch repeat-containing protein [Acidobacteriota bacterium]
MLKKRFLFLALVTCWHTVIAGEIRGFWEDLPPMPTPRQEVATALLGGDMYVLGGLTDTIPGTATVEVFDTAAGQWRAAPPLPRGIHHGSAAVLDGKIYSVGGFGAAVPIFGNPIADVYEFDPDLGAWQVRAPLPSVRGSLFTVALQGRLYAIGGRDTVNSRTDVTVYDPVQNQWSQAAPLPLGLDHLAAAVVEGKIYVAGGRVTQGGFFLRNDPSAFVYDAQLDQWSPLADLPTPRSGHAAASVAGFLLVVGGEEPGRVFNQNEAYAPAEDRWISLPDLPTARHGLAIASVGNRMFTAGGGTVANIQPTGQAEVFNLLSFLTSLPQIGVGPDITSRLVLGNPGRQPLHVVAEFHRGEAGDDFSLSLDGQSASQLQLGIAAEGRVTLTTDPAALTGSAAATLFSNAPLLGNVLFSGPQGFAGVAVTEGGRRLFVNLSRDTGEGADSGVALADLSGQSNLITLSLLDSQGQLLSQRPLELEGFGQAARLISELFEDDVPDPFNGSLRIEGQGLVGAVAILLRPGQFATLPVSVVE